MNIVISGGNGTVGKQLSENLSKRNYILSICNKKKPKAKKNIKYILYKDFINLEKKKVKKYKVFIHAATRHFGRSIIKYNTEIFNKMLLKLIKKNLIVLNLSSISVFDSLYQKKLLYNAKTKSKTNYGKSKIKIEKFLDEVSSNFQLRSLSLRLPIVLGSQINKFIFFENLKNKMIKNKNLIMYNEKKLFNHVVSIDSIIQFINKKIFYIPIGHKKINIGSKSPIKMKTLVELFKKKFNYKKKIIWKIKKKKSFLIDTFGMNLIKFPIKSTKNIILNFLNNI